MYSSLLSALPRTLRTAGFRLTAAFTVLMALLCLLILGMSYRLLAASLERRDQEAVAEKFWDIQSKALTLNPDQLREEVGFERKRGKDGPFYVRLFTQSGKTILQHGHVSPERLAGLSQPEIGAAPMRLPETQDEPAFEIISRPISEDLILQVAKSAAAREDVLSNFKGIVLTIMIVSIAFGAVLGIVLSRRALRPVRKLITAVKSIRSGDFSARVASSGTQDELDALVVLFNEMLDRIERLVAGMRRALDDAAHELRTPLTRLRGTAEVALAEDQDPASQREALAECIEQSDIVISLIKTLMDISEAEHGALTLDLEPVDIGELLKEAESLYRFTAEDKGVTVRVESPDGIIIRGDRNRLRRVVGNLLDNALKYSPRGGNALIKCYSKNGEAAIAVSDTGPGITPEDMPRIWDRLYRGQAGQSEKGLGLGLSLVKAFVAAHRGRVDVTSAPGSGSTFTAYLPL